MRLIRAAWKSKQTTEVTERETLIALPQSMVLLYV